MKKLTNQRFNRLIAICPTDKRSGAHIIWLCRCDCGNLKEISGNSLLTGLTKSCGCLNREKVITRQTTHGDASNERRLPLYDVWQAMCQRYSNPNNPCYKNYGGRGIIICNEWKNYQSFKDWALQNGYQQGLTIDRIDNNGNYEPSNCQWITGSENSKKPKHKKEIRRNHV